uniref:Zgc:92518 n=1 Tax=Cyprinus carpio TaxID=7962 RepID=A0A8C1YWD4_CYPCA
MIEKTTWRHFLASLIKTEAWEGYEFADMEIKITESTDCYGAVLWPSAMVLCHFLDTHREEYNLMDKNIIELGAGTGLVTIVTSLLGQQTCQISVGETAGGKIPVHNLSVVYAHPYLHELMETFMHLSSDDTIILWAMRFRLDPENSFVDTFEKHFRLEELYDLPSQIKLYIYT